MEIVVKNLAANAGNIRDVGLIPGLGRSPRGEHGNPLQYSCLDNPTDRGAWRAMVHRIAKSQTQLEEFSTFLLVVPVVMYGCESWTVKKAEHQRLMLLNCGVGEDS